MYSYIAIISIINSFSFLLFVLSFVSGQSTIRSKNEKTSSSKRKILRRVRRARREKKEEHLTYFCCFISRAKRSGLLPPPLNFVSVYCSLVEKITQFNAIIGVLLRLKCFVVLRENCSPRTPLTARCCCLYHYYSQEQTRAFADEWW